MTVQTSDRTITHAADGVQVEFSYNFLVYEREHMFAFDANGVEVTDFSMTGLGEAGGGLVTFQTAPAAPTITLVRTVPLTQLIKYIQDDPFPSKSHERGLDLGVMGLQQLGEELVRNLVYRITDSPTNAQRTLPPLSSVPGKFFGWDSNGIPVAADALGVPVSAWGAAWVLLADSAAGRATLGAAIQAAEGYDVSLAFVQGAQATPAGRLDRHDVVRRVKLPQNLVGSRSVVSEDGHTVNIEFDLFWNRASFEKLCKVTIATGGDSGAFSEFHADIAAGDVTLEEGHGLFIVDTYNTLGNLIQGQKVDATLKGTVV